MKKCCCHWFCGNWVGGRLGLVGSCSKIAQMRKFGLRARGERAPLWRRRRPLKLAPLRRPKATASAAQAPLPPPCGVDQKDRLRQAARPPPPCQPGRDSTAACASAEPHASQSTTARQCALLQSATTPARAQQRGGVRFCRGPTPASQGARARRRALLQSAMSARAQQHASARFCRAPPRQPEDNSTAACAYDAGGPRQPARAQQHGGARFCRAPRQPEHNSTPACASAECHHASQSTTAR
jgi:hypothetical protein